MVVCFLFDCTENKTFQCDRPAFQPTSPTAISFCGILPAQGKPRFRGTDSDRGIQCSGHLLIPMPGLGFRQ